MTDFLRSILDWFYNLTSNYGLAVICFTLFIRLVLTPFEYKSRKGMRKMQKIQPKLNALQQKYANDKQRLQQKQTELMQKEKYNPLSGCLPLLLQWPILFCMFYAMRDIANEKLIEQVVTFLNNEVPVYESFLWVKNVFMPDSPFKSVAVDAGALMGIGADLWKDMLAKLDPAQIETMLQNIRAAVPAALELTQAEILNFESARAMQTTIDTYLIPALQQMPLYVQEASHVTGWKDVSFILFSVTLFKNFNGLLILPALSGLTQMLMTKMNPASQPSGDEKQQNSGMNAFMKYFFPVFSVFICLTSNAGFALYWVTINIFATVQTIALNKYLDHKEAMEEKQVATTTKGSVK
ncbi:MAG: YidC/Oxa1 family membrane protein insertase [Clostridia bacterium]|nr:YidC/Oxa1 family membrane protein insertase [Clostridia bacterium]